jgi:hypothetical protein
MRYQKVTKAKPHSVSLNVGSRKKEGPEGELRPEL